MSKKNKPVRVKLIANPGAGKASNAADNLNLVIGYLEKNGLKVDVAFAKPKEEATPITRKAIKDGYKTVIAMGGDGTIEAVMRGMMGSKARLGIVPAGTENNIAKSLGIPKDLEEACALIASDHTLKLDMGQVTTRNGKKFVFFEMATIGLSAAVYPDANKAASGKLSSIKATAMTFIHQETRPKVFLTLNNESKIEVETMLVMVSNTPVFGKDFLVAPGASLQDGLLDISVYPDFGKVELIRYYAAVMDGGYSGDGKVQRYQARKIKVKTSPKLDVMADGVELGKGTVKIKVRKNALRVITAEQSPGVGIPLKDAVETQPVPVSPTVEKNLHVESLVSTQ
ncbi:MAG TPA: diacylglycerol kinase family protein [Anaerolineales bacterium]|nr:diacylglycerol kinase family protein [Anaerolineales bacterium]